MNIIILCYPPHATHIFQGLDVVLFSVAKAEWTKSRDRFERERGEVLTKETFLQVFGEAYLAAFTPENNKKAFEKTGVHPFNPSVIKPTDLAPSLEHSLHAHVPLELPSPVKGMMHIYRQTIHDIQCERDRGNGWEDLSDDNDNDAANDESDNGNRDDSDDSDDDIEPGTGDHAGRAVRCALQSSAPESVPVPTTPSAKRCTNAVSVSTLHQSPLRIAMAAQTPVSKRLHRALRNSTNFSGLVDLSLSRAPDPIPKRTYLQPTTTVSWNSLPRPAENLQDEVDMLQEQLAQARARDEQYSMCLEAAHSQLALLGCYAETCRNHAMAARKKTSKKGKRL